MKKSDEDPGEVILTFLPLMVSGFAGRSLYRSFLREPARNCGRAEREANHVLVLGLHLDRVIVETDGYIRGPCDERPQDFRTALGKFSVVTSRPSSL